MIYLILALLMFLMLVTRSNKDFPGGFN